MNSRVIAFRAWDIENNKMIYPNPVSSSLLLMTWTGSVYKQGVLQKLKLLQFIGINDKNDKMICEGDIVKLEYEDYKAPPPKDNEKWPIATAHGIVTYCPSIDCGCDDNHDLGGHAGFKIKQLSGYRWAFYGPECEEFNWNELEVIGNIYENPELVQKIKSEKT